MNRAADDDEPSAPSMEDIEALVCESGEFRQDVVLSGKTDD
jgi:hypothetical protein